MLDQQVFPLWIQLVRARIIAAGRLPRPDRLNVEIVAAAAPEGLTNDADALGESCRLDYLWGLSEQIINRVRAHGDVRMLHQEGKPDSVRADPLQTCQPQLAVSLGIFSVSQCQGGHVENQIESVPSRARASFSARRRPLAMAMRVRRSNVGIMAAELHWPADAVTVL
jgi:hypothetical protein